MDRFARRLLAWYDRCGRHDLPWQHPRSPYRVWVSEVMLQQTRVATVIPYFERFVAALPDVAALAAAPNDRVLSLWAGLGYYRRALQLHATARLCVARHDGELPADFEGLMALPGIGRSTAGAIMAQAHGRPYAILDGNVKRVLARFHGIRGWPGSAAVEARLWTEARAHLPAARSADYAQALMDLGATICTRAQPDCGHCPLAALCVARRGGSTAQLPTPRPHRAIQERRAIFVVLRDRGGRVLLVRRPIAGVWPGLWCFPDAPDEAAATRLAGSLADLGKATCTALPPFRHGFTHFTLTLVPLVWDRVRAADAAADAPDRCWSTPDAASHRGLPAPIAKLLRVLPPRRGPRPRTGGAERVT